MSVITLLINGIIIATSFPPILKFRVGKGSCPCNHGKYTGNGYFSETEGFGKSRGKCI